MQCIACAEACVQRLEILGMMGGQIVAQVTCLLWTHHAEGKQLFPLLNRGAGERCKLEALTDARAQRLCVCRLLQRKHVMQHFICSCSRQLAG